MAKSNLNELIDWLANDPLNRFEIYDVDQEIAIQKCISYADILKKFPTAVSYFERLADDGIKTIQIVKKRKSGSAFVRESCGLNFALDTKGNVAVSGSQDRPAATPQQTHSNSLGLMGLGNPGAGNNFGLGLPDIMEMKSQADRYQELKETFVETKRRNEELEKENRKLENENLRHQLGVETKPSAIDKLVEGIANNPSALPQIIASFKGGSTPGLNAPELPKKQLSDTKSTVVDLISNNEQVQDDHVAASYYVLVEALKGNEKFLEDYSVLLNKHKLIQNGSNDNSYS